MSFGYVAGFYLAALFANPVPDKWDFQHFLPEERQSCRVLAVTPSAIMVSSLKNENGIKINQIVTFPFHHRLACGSFNQLNVFDSFCYTRDDVRAGDRIDLQHRVFRNNIDYCIDFRIRERPGGAVPPTRRYRTGDFKPHHECMNAILAERYDKIPLPRHLGVFASSANYPAFDPNVPRKERLAPWPSKAPFSYMEYVLFLR